jgi:beta-phosphoglucomutase-like phosphatase (HAD superfamily)
LNQTEELHRQAYNMAFKKFGLTLPDGTAVNWSTSYYDILQNTVGGGKPKMKHFFNNV